MHKDSFSVGGHNQIRVGSFLAVAAVLLFLPKAVALDPTYSITQYPTKLWQIDQGLSHNSVIAIAQTRDGFLWCGTENGLARFDGSSFKIFDRGNIPGLLVSSIPALLVDRKERLWVATGGSGLFLYDGETFERYYTKDGLVGDTVKGLAEDRDGAIWITTTSGVSRFADGTFTNFKVADGLPSDLCHQVAIDRNNTVWIGTNQGLCSYENGHFQSYTHEDGLPGNNIIAIYPNKSGDLLIGTHSLGLSKKVGKRFEPFYKGKGNPPGFVRNVREDRQGNTWLATNEGLLRWRDGEQTGHYIREGMDGGIVFCVYEDVVGNLWVGTNDGLLWMGNGRCRTFTTDDGLIGDLVWCSFQDRKGNLWVGTDSGASMYRDGKWTNFTRKEGLSTNSVHTITEDINGAVWFGTRVGLTRYSEGKFTHFTTADGLTNNFILAVYVDRKNQLWIGYSGGGVSIYRDGKFETVPIAKDLHKIIARVFCEDRNGDMWIGTVSRGVCVVRNSVPTWYTARDGLSSDTILDIKEDSKGAIWIGTHGSGLNCYRAGNWSKFDHRNGLPDNVIYQIIEDGTHLWMSSTRGIFRVRNEDLAGNPKAIPSLLLSKNDGMRLVDCSGGTQPAGCRSQDGRLWFPTSRGLVSINPSAVHADTFAPQVRLEEIKSNGVSLPGTRSFVVPPESDRLEFHYSATQLTSPERVQFRYKLEGFDEEWNEAGNRRTAYYTNINPGTYQFQVMACNGDGVWSPTPMTVVLTVQPHFFETVWFYVLCVVGTLSLLFGFHLLRTHRLRINEERLAQRVAERTAELQKEIREHARTSELLRQSQKLEAVGQFAGGIAHDFNNILTVIIGYADLMKEHTSPQNQDYEILGEMLEVSQRAKGLTQQLLAFSRRQVLEPRVIDPNTTVSEMERMLRRVVGANVTIHTSLTKDLYRVKVDPVQLQQVLLNLAVNARDAMPSGGQFMIATRNETIGVGKQEPGAVTPGDYAVISVSDTGTGMSPEVKERLFEPFFTTKSPGMGTGLGLATVYGIVQQSSGHITVESELGKGTEFRIYLPRTDDEPEPITTQEKTLSVTHLGETILLVEDEPTIRLLARSVLLKCGYRVLEAEDGEQALKVSAEFNGPISLLVSDVMMPNMGGHELAIKLRESRPELRILFVSGFTDDANLRSGGLESVVDLLQKPYKPSELAAKIRSILDSQPVAT